MIVESSVAYVKSQTCAWSRVAGGLFQGFLHINQSMTCQEEFVKILDKAINANETSYVEYDWINDNAYSISKPPRLTTIRVNTLKVDVAMAREAAQRILTAQNPGFRVSQHQEFDDLLVIAPLGPFTVEPKQRRAIVSVECAQAVLRGSEVFAPGVLAVSDAPAVSEAYSLVSVWADLGGRCTRGLRKNYTGRMCFIGNGQLVQVKTLRVNAGGE